MSTKPPTGRSHVWTPFWRRFTDQRSHDLRDTIALHQDVTAAWRADFWSNPQALDTTTNFIFDKLDGLRPVPEVLRDDIRKAIRAILELETHIFTSADINWQSADLSLKEQVDLRRFLRAQQFFLSHQNKHVDLLVEIIISSFAHIIDALPKLPATPSFLSVPMIDLLSSPGQVIDRINATVNSADLEDAGLFSTLRETIYLNACRASDVMPYDQQRKPLTTASEAGLAPQELVAAYHCNTPFGDVLSVSAPFSIPRQRFNEHGALFAKSGHGKTQALRAIVAQFLQEPDPPALFLLDSLGSLIEGIPELEVFTTTLRDRLLILDPSDPRHMPRLNFFNLQSDDLCFYLFKAIDQSFTPRQATMISYLMEYMRHVPEPSLFKLVQVCESKTNPYPEVVERLSAFARAFIENQFFAGRGGDTLVQQTKSQIAQRLYTLGRLSKFAEIFSARSDLFDPYECMQNKRIVLINTDARPPDQGGLGEASAIFGRYILAQCLAAARRRAKNQRHLSLLVVDEAKAYMDQQAALILSDARQFGLGMLLASQFPHQLDEGVRREINTNTSIRMMGAIEYSVAAQYARDMFCEPDFITRMKSYDRSHAEWAAYVSGMDHAIKLEIPFGTIERMPKSKQPPGFAVSSTVQNEQPKQPWYAEYGIDPEENPYAPYELEKQKTAPTQEPPSQATTEAAAVQDHRVTQGNPTAEGEGSLIKPGKDWE